MPADNVTPLHPGRYFVAPDARERVRSKMVLVPMGVLLDCAEFADRVLDARITYADVDHIQDHQAALHDAITAGEHQ
jgi:hypothetical protein